MQKVFLINVTFSDDQTYSYTETMAVSTDEVKANQLKDAVKELYPDDKTSVEEVETNKIIQ